MVILIIVVNITMTKATTLLKTATKTVMRIIIII